MQKKIKLKTWLPLIIIATIAILFFLSGAYKYFSFTFLRRKISIINQFASTHMTLSIIIALVTYIICTAIPTPLPAVLTMLGGYLFGGILATWICCTGEALGGWVLFKAIQTSFGRNLFASSISQLNHVRNNIEQNVSAYICLFRFSCFTPSFAINLLAGLSNISSIRFLTITFLSSIPAGIIFSSFGKNLIKIINSPDGFSYLLLLKINIIIPLSALILLLIISIPIKKKLMQKRK